MVTFNNTRKRARTTDNPIKVTLAKPALTPFQKKEINALIRKAEAKDEEMKVTTRGIGGTLIPKLNVSTVNLFDIVTPGVGDENDLIGSVIRTKRVELSLFFSGSSTDPNDQKVITVALVKSSKYVVGTTSLLNVDLLYPNTLAFPTPVFDRNKCTVIWKKTKVLRPTLTSPAQTAVVFDDVITFKRTLKFKSQVTASSELNEGNYYLVFWVTGVNTATGTAIAAVQGGVTTYFTDA